MENTNSTVMTNIFDNKTLKIAVKEWCSDPSEANKNMVIYQIGIHKM